MFTALYQIIIMPLIQLTEFFYELFYEITNNKGIAVIGLSFVVTLFTLPLYMVAEKWQETERNIQDKLKNGVSRIKTTFSGDEQYMVLSTFYKQNHYHPIMALRSSFSLLIQIPFFIAAYNFLSNLGELRGYSFLFIKDFGAPDATFFIGSFAINVLPIAMTIINCVAGAIYSKGHNKSEKIQIYACALVFLLLLYNSPAGLVVYWTMNNILSLVKNIFYKIKNPKKVIYIISCSLAVVFLFSSIFFMTNLKTLFRIFIVLFCIIIPFIPYLIKVFSKILDNHFYELDNKPKLRFSLFFISAIILTVLIGVSIPSTLMQSEPEQYCFIDSYKSPFIFIRYTLYQAIGFFIVWPLCFYALFSTKTKKVMAVFSPIIAFIAIINSFAFSGHYGPISPDLIFMQPQHFAPPLKNILFNLFILFVAATLVILFIQKFTKIVNSLCSIVLLALVLISGKNIFSIAIAYKNMNEPIVKDSIQPIFHLSKEGKNVIVLMQDRFFSPLIPVILDKNPELKKELDGFVYFPNTVSFGQFTMIGTPGIFGGYDYTPFEINKRTDKTLQEKHNEAILSMPVLFDKNNWNTTISDMPYENYLEQPVTDMYKGYESINRVTTRGVYSDVWYKLNNMKKSPFMSESIKRNFIWFGFFKAVPPVLRQVIYHNEYWLSYNKYDDTSKFIDNYSEIDFLPELFDTSALKDSFFLLDNEANHESILLQAPNYVPCENVKVDDDKYSKDTQYSSMTGILFRLSEFISYLKQNNVYDNTKIIIVSDHGMGRDMDIFDNKTQHFPFKKEGVTAALLVKDFNSKGEIKFDNTFMTNADTPYLATKNLINEAKNPFTNNKLKVENKNDYIKIVIAPAESTRIRKNSKFSIKDDEWYSVKNNIFEDSNWSKYKENKND